MAALTLVLSLARVAAPATAVAQVPAAHGTLRFAGVAHAFDVGANGVRLTFGSSTTTGGNAGLFDFLNAGPAATVALRPVTVGSQAGPVASLFTVGGYTFNLTGLPVGRFFDPDVCYFAPEAAGQQCSPLQTPGDAISPFELANLEPSIPGGPLRSTASFRLVGTVSGVGGDVRPFLGTIATEFPVSFRQALGGLEALSRDDGPGLPGIEYTAEFQVGPAVVTPEPTTVAAVGAGLLALAGVARRRRAAGRRGE